MGHRWDPFFFLRLPFGYGSKFATRISGPQVLVPLPDF